MIFRKPRAASGAGLVLLAPKAVPADGTPAIALAQDGTPELVYRVGDSVYHAPMTLAYNVSPYKKLEYINADETPTDTIKLVLYDDGYSLTPLQALKLRELVQGLGTAALVSEALALPELRGTRVAQGTSYDVIVEAVRRPRMAQMLDVRVAMSLPASHLDWQANLATFKKQKGLA